MVADRISVDSFPADEQNASVTEVKPALGALNSMGADVLRGDRALGISR